MPRRSITDEEIGLIKAMLARGMANKDIQFYFNRQDRSVNSGRVTQIKQRTYVLTEDCPSFFADMLTLDHNGNVSGLIEEGDENGG